MDGLTADSSSIGSPASEQVAMAKCKLCSSDEVAIFCNDMALCIDCMPKVSEKTPPRGGGSFTYPVAGAETP
jgi:hypothetical protein